MKRLGLMIGAAALFMAPAVFAQGRSGFAPAAVDKAAMNSINRAPVTAPAPTAVVAPLRQERGDSRNEGRDGRRHDEHRHDSHKGHGHGHTHNHDPHHSVQYQTVIEVIPGYWDTVERCVYVEGFYETVHEQVFVPGAFKEVVDVSYIGKVRIETRRCVWVPAHYETVCKQVYRPGYHKTVKERVWVPEQIVRKTVPVVIHHHR